MRIAVMGGNFQAWQLVFGYNDFGLAALRSWQSDERRVLRIRPAHGCKPFYQLPLVRSRQQALTPNVDQRGPGAVRHAEYDLAPAVFVISVTKNLLVGMAKIAILGQQLLFFASPGKAQKPFRSRQLGRD